jgi:hypothetical protein
VGVGLELLLPSVVAYAADCFLGDLLLVAGSLAICLAATSFGRVTSPGGVL